ncbi:MAG: GreA/GreB family elongation factor [Thermoanaerobaculia bacterium]|nr:GreA/GreB family elongation factor [Thermoanaerobaculia bacterium]
MSRKESTLSSDLSQKIEAGEFDAVEDLWLQRIEVEPDDLEWFVETSKAVSSVDSDMAQVLLQTLDDQLQQLGHSAIRRKLLRRSGRSMYPNVELHDAILETLETIHSDHSALQDLIEHVGLRRAIEDIPKTWQKADKLEALLDYDVGTVVRMKGKGVATIREVNLTLENFLVDFASGLELRVGFAAAAKMLDALPKSHVLRRKVEEPEVLLKLSKDDPPELLRLVLESEGKSLNGSEVKAILDGVVSPQGWNRFWNAARKHPQVISDPKKRHAVRWAESTEEAQGTLMGNFEAAKLPERFAMLRRDAARDDSLKRNMSKILWRQAERLRRKLPGSAAEIWLQLEKSGELPEGDTDWRPEKLIRDSRDVPKLVSDVDDRTFRERMYRVVREVRDDWGEHFVTALWQESDARALDTLSEALLEDDPETFWTFFDQLVSQPRKNAAGFTWLLERAADRAEWMQRNPLRLMRQFLGAMTDDSFASVRAARLVPLTESGGTLPRLLDHLAQDQAEVALETVATSPGLEDYQREPLANAIKLRFPDLHKETEAPLYATHAMIREKRAELKHLAEVEIPENRQAIEEARELGDLRENFEYHAARRRHEQLSDRAGKLEHDLRRVRPIDPTQVSGNEITIGATVTFEKDGDKRQLTFLGPWESDPERGILSNETDLAQKALGKKNGDSAELPDGEYVVVAIEPWTPDA